MKTFSFQISRKNFSAVSLVQYKIIFLFSLSAREISEAVHDPMPQAMTISLERTFMTFLPLPIFV